jgi:hypothetical protein
VFIVSRKRRIIWKAASIPPAAKPRHVGPRNIASVQRAVVPCATPIYPAAVVLLILGLMTAALPLQAQTAPGGKPAAPTDVGVVTVTQSDAPYI